MIVFEVAANEHVVRAGAPDQTSLSLRLNGGDGFPSPQLSISAFRVTSERLEKHYRWEFGPLALGDQVTIRLLDEGAADPPSSVDDTSKPDLTRDEKALLRHETAKVKRLNEALQRSIAEATQDPTTMYCSFCGRSQHEAKQLIAGPAVFICDECVATSAKLLGESSGGAHSR
jgi:hypothetical protein